MDGKFILYIFIILIVIEPLLMLLARKINKSKRQPKEKATYTYCKKPYLLTENENRFYKELLPIATEMNLTVCPKVRIADIIEPRKGQNWQGAFAKIQAKHIDFLLCKGPVSPALAIELDDSSHEREDRKERDSFVDQAFQSANLPILHIKNASKLKEKITQALN